MTINNARILLLTDITTYSELLNLITDFMADCLYYQYKAK